MSHSISVLDLVTGAQGAGVVAVNLGLVWPKEHRSEARALKLRQPAARRGGLSCRPGALRAGLCVRR